MIWRNGRFRWALPRSKPEMRAWYKPFHEPSPAIGRIDTAEQYAYELRRLDRHDLKILREFWRGEVKLLENGQPLDTDLSIARQKLARLNAEIERRNDADG